MFVELLDKLRCLNAHEDSPLICTASRTENRYVLDGTLGCPVCHAEYEIVDGVVQYGGSIPLLMITEDYFSDERCTQIAAMLGLDERGGVYFLEHMTAYYTGSLSELAPAARFVVVHAGVVEGASGVVLCNDVVPLAPGSLRGVVLDGRSIHAALSAVKALAPGGRLVADVSLPVPDGIEILARDSNYWVGERVPDVKFTKLSRA